MIRDRSDFALSRRHFVRTAGAAGAGILCGAGFFGAPASAASARDPRLVVIILRGALDGLSAVPPLGDPDYADLHGDLAFTASGDRAALPLDGFFFAHPALAAFKRLYDKRQAAVVHAVATGYRDRSHFDGQDVLESGYPVRGGRRAAGLTERWALCHPARAFHAARRRRDRAPVIRGRRPLWAGRRRAASRRRAAISRSACSTSTVMLIWRWGRSSARR